MMKRIFLYTLLSSLSLQLSISQEKFNGLAAGPYKKLVIREAMVIPGHGGPPVGPYDIIISGNQITDMIPFDPVTSKSRGEIKRETGDRVIDAKGKYVMPGMIDLHMHLRTDPMPLEYVYYLKLAHGVTSMVPGSDRGLKSGIEQSELSAKNKILAPKLYPIWSYGAMTNFDKIALDDPKNAPEVVKQMFAKG